MFGISGGEFLVLLVVVVVFLGPKHAAQALMSLRRALMYVRGFSEKMRKNMTSQRTASVLADLGFSEEDLQALREMRSSTGSLDPRAFVRKAVAEEMDAWLEDVAPVAARPATNVPSSGEKTKTLAQIQAELRAKNEDVKTKPVDLEENHTSEENVSVRQEEKERQ
ncbi:MAG: hypothetical protein J6M18_06440 [Actinomycetaceae bacterium]|nr:hypothetical protein [Actinomycetaceae bacterium]